MGRGERELLARGGERLRCHRPLSLSRFPIRVSTINKFVLHSPRSLSFFVTVVVFYFIYLFGCRAHRTLEAGSSTSSPSSSWQSWRFLPTARPTPFGFCVFFTIIVIIVSFRIGRPCKCFCCRWAGLLALSNCCQHFKPVPV